jgi:DNA-binding transcriptional MerR regulator
MPETTEIPNRALFKAAEVCDIVKVQPYVLRSWEAEFPDLGVTKAAGAPRVYRRADVEQVVKIKHLLLVEGLTLAGARKKLTDDTAPVAADAPVIDELLGRNARERLTDVKRGLQAILDLLAATPLNATPTDIFATRQLHAVSSTQARRVSRGKPPRAKVKVKVKIAASRASARRKRA